MTVHDTVVICATSRLAQTLKLQTALRQGQAGEGACAALHALTVGQWLNEWVEQASLRGLCSGHPCQRVVLDTYQERLLWERVIGLDLGHHADTLFDVASLARSAMEAHALAVTWNVATDASELSEESQRFVQWRQLFYRECDARGWIDAARWQQSAIDAFPQWAAQLRLPSRVVFSGFTRLNPQETRLRQQLIDLQLVCDDGVPGSQPVRAAKMVEPTSYAYPDMAAEALAAALWAQARLQEFPQGQYAIVVPDLADARRLLQDTLENVLMPEAVYPGQSETPRPFNISLGLSLARFPLVDTALQLLRWMASAHRVEQSAISALLRNPYWSDATVEGATRALIDAELRKRVSPAAPLRRFVEHMQRQLATDDTPDLPVTAYRVVTHGRRALAWSALAVGLQRPSDWARQLPTLLHETGWLYERKLSSHEYQTREAFLECIDALPRLDALLGEVSLAEVTTHLRRLCLERTFQPKTEGRPRLQVLGLLETSGLQFDGLWIMGMQDSVWPPPARPNPLLPAEAQRRVGAPNASASIQLAFAQQLHAMLLAAAPEVVFSWSRMAGAAELNPSPLIPPTPAKHHLSAPVSPHWTHLAAQQGPVQLAAPIDDHIAPPVSAHEQVRGGTWLLRAQAICPAWAYFQYRLGAVRLEEPVEGLDARQRGNFLHDSLEYFWTRVQTSDGLRSMSPDARQRLVADAVACVLDAHDADPRHEPLKPRLRALEQERLQRLIEGWLQVELERQHHYTVIANEREVHVDIQGIRFRMFIDRIDQLDDGSLLVIDYKTGATIDTDNWATRRLTEPQLPIYAAIQPPPEGPVVGVVFAKVLMKDPAWAGLAWHDGLLPKVTGLDSKAGRKLFSQTQFPDWGSVLQHWRQCVHDVAQDIKAGEAGVRFDRADDLRWCDVKPLLRLDERQAQWQALQATFHESGEAAA